MNFYKMLENGYILGVGKGNGGTQISESEYNNILSVLRNAPAGKPCMLKEDLTWEEIDIEEEVDDTEAFDIIFGGES